MALEITADRVFYGFLGRGVYYLLLLAGGLALVLPGRLWPQIARPHGYGRHVEALLILSFVSTQFHFGLGNVPVWIDGNQIVAFSLVGAILPTILSIHFLIRAGWMAALTSLVVIGICAAASYFTSHPIEGLGIASFAPDMFLSATLAGIGGALIGHLTAPHRLHSLGIAYACGSMGALIGADLVRINWILGPTQSGAASFGGADANDLVFLGGVWAAAIASLSLWGLWKANPPAKGEWDDVVTLTIKGDLEGALTLALTIAERNLDAYVVRNALLDKSRADVMAKTFAEPVFRRAQVLRGNVIAMPKDYQRVLEDLEGLCRRLARAHVQEGAPMNRRVAAALIDAAIPIVVAIGALVIALGVPVDPATGGVQPTAANIGIALLFAFWWATTTHIVYPIISEWVTDGSTIGKGAMRLRVRRLAGKRLRGWDCVVRNVGRLMDLPIFYVIPFLATKGGTRQRLGDYFAETVVVDVRNARKTSTATAVTTVPIANAIQANSGTLATDRAPR